MPVLSVVTHSEEQTVALAQKLAPSFVAGDVIILSGDLGSGKTTFVRAVAAAKGIDEETVNSPSYTFVNEYTGNPPLYHIDLYRLGQTSELTEIGWDEYLGRGGITLVEWGERAEGLLPDRYYLMRFEIVDETERKIELSLVQP